MEQGLTSSPLPPEPFLEPSADTDAPDAGHMDNIEQTSSSLPSEPFPEHSPSHEPQQPEPQPPTSSAIRGTPAKLINWTDPSHFCHQIHHRLQILLYPPLYPGVIWAGLFLYDIG